MSRARRERHSGRLTSGRLTSGCRRPLGPASPSSFLPRLSRAARAWPAAAVALTLLAAPASAQDAPRLLTGLSAEVGPGGVALSWTVDESRAHRITGFTCVYLTPGHLKTGGAGGVPCDPVQSPAGARGRTVAGLPEYGDHDFELVAVETKDGPAIPWPQRALRLRVAVTGDLAGFPASAAFEGNWRAAAHGPEAGEAAGRLRLWTPLPDGADRATEWTGQAVLVAGFGAARATGRAQ